MAEMDMANALDEKEDGRLYSLVTRKCVAILKHIRAGRRFVLSEIAAEIFDKNYPEFMRYQGGSLVRVSARRIRDYVSFLVDLKLIVSTDDDRYTVSLTKPSKDAQWAQLLSDHARELMAGSRAITPREFTELLDRTRRKLLRGYKVPTVTAVVDAMGVVGPTAQEEFRWSLYLYADGDASPFEVRRFPHLQTTQ